jgi:hypothetical protein
VRPVEIEWDAVTWLPTYEIPAGLKLRPAGERGSRAIWRTVAYPRQVRDSATLLGMPSI